MDTQKKTSNKRTLIIIAVGGILVTCLCLVIIAVVYSPTKSSVSQKTTQDSKVKVLNTETLTLDMGNTVLPKPTDMLVQTNTPAASKTPGPTNTPAASRTPRPTNTITATPNPNLLKPGVYLIGKDIKPGIYKGEDAGCYWERLKDLSGSFDSIIANGNTNGTFYIEVKESDAALSTNCDVVLLDPLPEHTGEYPQTLESGVYLVGIDIKPGTYKGEDAGCYWERLKDLSGSFDAIIANNNTNGQFYIQVKENDAALSTNCEVVLLDPLPEHTGEYPQTLEPGVYLVGIDIKPGTYKGEDAGCYWERLKDLSGSFDAIIANDNTNGQFYIEVNESDAALSINCEVVLANE